MRRRFARRGRPRRRARQDLIWGPFVFQCAGTNPSKVCTQGADIIYPFLTNADWQPDASSDVSFDHATLLRTIFTLTWTAESESNASAFIWGLVRYDRNISATDLGTLWAPAPWGAYDVLWGPHVQSYQSFGANPLTVDLQTKRRLSSNDRVGIWIQGNDQLNQFTFWASGRYLINRE